MGLLGALWHYGRYLSMAPLPERPYRRNCEQRADVIFATVANSLSLPLLRHVNVLWGLGLTLRYAPDRPSILGIRTLFQWTNPADGCLLCRPGGRCEPAGTPVRIPGLRSSYDLDGVRSRVDLHHSPLFDAFSRCALVIGQRIEPEDSTRAFHGSSCFDDCFDAGRVLKPPPRP